jgi:hypothetical protein
MLILNGWYWLIEVLQVKYLNNIIEQDHRFIKKLTKQMKGLSYTKGGICVNRMPREGSQL